MTEQIKEAIEIWRSRDLIQFFLDDIQNRVKRDKPTKTSVYIGGLSAFTGSPLNLFLKGETSIGKTYNSVQTLRYFPEDIVIFLGGMSRKSLIHEHGVLLNKNGEEIDLDARPVKPKRRDYDSKENFDEAMKQFQEDAKAFREELKDSYTLVDLTGKILVFLETPEHGTLEMLRPILSHDKLEIPYKFVDKTGKGSMRTMNVRIRGWPATIFLTIDKTYMEEIATRSFTVTPEDSDLKRIEANMVTNEQLSYPWQFEADTEAFKIIQKLLEKLRDLTSDGKVKVVVPFPELHSFFPHDLNRDMRDFQHYGQFLATIMLLHYFQRPFMKHGETRYIIATIEDVTRALEVYRELLETTRTGTEKRTLNFYHDIIAEKDEHGNFKRDCWYLKNLTEAYNERYRKKLSEASIRAMLLRLDEIGYVNTRQDDVDERKKVYIPLVKDGTEKLKIASKLDSQIDFRLKLKTAFETWLTRCFKDTVYFSYKNNPSDPSSWGEEQITIEELSGMVMAEKNVFVKTPDSLKYLVNAEPNRLEEKKPQNILEADSKVILNKSAELKVNLGIPCPHCQAQGKKVYFLNDVDLRIHISAYHESQDYVR